jgi:hypothetical protein
LRTKNQSFTIIIVLILSTTLTVGPTLGKNIVYHETYAIDASVGTSKTTTTTAPNLVATQTSPFDSAKLLTQDAILALQNHDESNALVHLKLAAQQLALVPNSDSKSSSVQAIRTLLKDAEQAMVQNSDTNNALVHLKLAAQQFLVGTIPSSTYSIYNLILDGKTYQIKYQITGSENKLTSMTARVDRPAILVNIERF